ncbi:MAG: hypothetical protein AB7O57_23205 [Hyphomicrobiaceae bacterium]
MAERVAKQSKKPARKAPAAAPRESTGVKQPPAADERSEVARLTAELESVRAQLAALEAQREQLLNRIDWAIDSLHSLLEE